MTRLARSLLLGLAAALACAGPAPAAEKGVATDLTWGISKETAETEAALVAGLGAQWVALDFNWRNGEPSDGTYADTEFDAVARAIALARGAGARVLLTVSETPAWASGQSDRRYPPSDPAELAELYADLVDRFGPGVDAWQVWNEPNHPHFWQPDPTTDPNACATYAAMLKAAAPVIRAGDPTGRVLFAGLAWNDYAYLERCLVLVPDLPNSFDVMVTHPYALAGAAPETASDSAPQDGRLDYQTFLAYREIRRTLAKPIWFSEMGWSTCVDDHPLGCLTPELQASYLTRAYELIEQDEYVEVAIWYSLRNIGADGPSWLDQLGLYTNGFTPKPAAAAFRAYRPPGDQPVPDASPPSSGGSARARTTTVLRVRRGAPPRRRRRVARRLAGRVRGATAGTVTLVVQRRRSGGGYRRIKRVRAELSRTGAFSRRVVLRRGRRCRARARFAGTSQAAASSSRFVHFRTRR
jgi:polysaccharide biosynthesis protein PslG